MMKPSQIRLRIRLLLAVAGLVFPMISAAELFVVVNSDCDFDALSKSQVINIFLGRDREFPDGTKAIPIDLPASNPAKAEFYRSLVNKDLDQMAAYWSRFVFAGSTTPPYQARETQEVVHFVATHPGAVGYLNGPVKDSRLKVVLVIE